MSRFKVVSNGVETEVEASDAKTAVELVHPEVSIPGSYDLAGTLAHMDVVLSKTVTVEPLVG